jgi:hypothetical protein
MQMKIQPKGPQAAKLRQRKFAILRTLKLPENALPGSLSLSHRRCGKPTCRCASGQGHPLWSLTFMLDGKKRVERIPDDWVEEVGRQVEAGRELKQTIAEFLVANAQLLTLQRRQRGQ